MTTKKSNAEFQEKQINIQEGMKELTKQIHTITERHYIVMWILTGIIALSAFATFYCNYFLDKTGLYAISQSDTATVYVLNTKTGQLWLRTAGRENNYDLGTNENPKGIKIGR
jgi:hypothetical protein